MSTSRRDAEISQPLLGNRHSNHEELFSAGHDDHFDEGSWRDETNGQIEAHSPSFGPPLRSTQQSREAEFELDEDELDEAALEQLNVSAAQLSTRPTLLRQNSEQRMPLLVGLLDSATQRAPATTHGIALSRRSDVEEGLTVDGDLEEIAKKRTGGGGMLDSIANMANSILGAGIIGLPYAVSQAGFISGVFLLVVLCGVTDWTIRLIVINAKMSGRSSYMDIMSHCFGWMGCAAVSLFQFSFAFGGMAAFCVIIGDTIPHVVRSIFPGLQDSALSFLVSRQFLIILCTVCISYPLSLYRDISKLARASGFALIGMIIIVVSVIVEGAQVPEELRGSPDKRLTFINSGIFQAIGVISFAFVCHHNSLLIYGSLNTPTLDRFAAVTHISTLLSLVACCTLAISAFWVFTDKTQGNILNNFPQNDTFINVARFCFGMNMFTTLPLELFVCREVIEQYFFADAAWNRQRHIIITTTVLFGAMLISLTTCDLGVVLEVAGGVAATALAFIFPAACYYKLLPSSQRWNSRAKLPAVLCVGFGLLVLVLNLFIAIGHAWGSHEAPKQCY
ncbi:Vacuolar amino acid transporter 2 [Serendipita indica DSM 11827]|nr:Vacuolar amino acid transporter 2 [Serendipita indica DSM 11827]